MTRQYKKLLNVDYRATDRLLNAVVLVKRNPVAEAMALLLRPPKKLKRRETEGEPVATAKQKAGTSKKFGAKTRRSGPAVSTQLSTISRQEFLKRLNLQNLINLDCAMGNESDNGAGPSTANNGAGPSTAKERVLKKFPETFKKPFHVCGRRPSKGNSTIF